MPSIGTLELALILGLLAGFVALVLGLIFLARKLLWPSDQTHRISELEREVADLKTRQK